jgi:hypothetical protein
MNRFLPAVLIVLALAAAFFFSRPAPTPSQSPSNPTFPKRTLSGKVFAPQQVANLNVALLIADTLVASAKVENGDYRLELPSQLPFAPGTLDNTQLLHGDGRLPSGTVGSDSKLIMFDDQNNNGTPDGGEPQLEGSFFPPDKTPNLQGLFRYKLLLLGSAARLTENQDSATGAKDFYRYNLPLEAGWNIVEGEFASNGYDVRLRSETTWNILPMLPRGGNTAPPAFTPQ